DTESDGAVAEPDHPGSARTLRRTTARERDHGRPRSREHHRRRHAARRTDLRPRLDHRHHRRDLDRADAAVHRPFPGREEGHRRRIATELHDVIAHEITGIVVLAQAAGRSDNAQLTSTALGRIEASGTRALDEIRRLVSETRTEAASRTPIADGPQALRDRVESFGDRAQIAIDVGAIDDEAVWPVLDRVLVETLTNVRRHAG